MPIYEYTCDTCGAEFEHFARSMTRSEKPRCPQCGAARATRKHSTFAARQGEVSSPPVPGPCDRCSSPTCPMQMPS